MDAPPFGGHPMSQLRGLHFNSGKIDAKRRTLDIAVRDREFSVPVQDILHDTQGVVAKVPAGRYLLDGGFAVEVDPDLVSENFMGDPLCMNGSICVTSGEGEHLEELVTVFLG